MIADVSIAFKSWLETVTGIQIVESYVNGRLSETSNIISFDAVIQNANAEDLKVVEEGLRTEEAIKIHTTYAIQPFKTFIEYDGYNYLVQNIAKRKIGNYYKAIAIKQTE